MFAYIHLKKKSTKINKSTGVIEKELVFSPKTRVRAGIGFIFILLIIILVQFIPTTNQYIQEVYWPQPTVTIIPTLETPTDLVQPIPTETPVPTQTSEPTSIITPVPFSEFIIKKDCIPLGWKTLAGAVLPKDQLCLPVDKVGITSIDNGLDFVIKSNDQEIIQTMLPGTSYKLNGIYMPVPEGMNTISFKIITNEIVFSPYDVDIDFFFGTINPNEIAINKSYGNFITFSHSSMLTYQAYTIYSSENPIFADNPKISPFTLGKEQEITIIFNKLVYSVEIDGVTPTLLKDLPYPSTGYNLFFGFLVPLNGGLSVSISDIQFNK